MASFALMLHCCCLIERAAKTVVVVVAAGSFYDQRSIDEAPFVSAEVAQLE